MVRQAADRRAAESRYDPRPGYLEALSTINERLPLAINGLQSRGYPDHKKQREIDYAGRRRLAWVRSLRSPDSELVKEGRARPFFVALVVDDNGSAPPRGTLLESHSVNGEFVPLDLSPDQDWIVHVWGIAGFLDVLSGDPKRDPWDE